MERVSKENYYLDIAQTVTERATCLRRVYGAIIVKNDEIISTGYNGAPRGRKNCVDLGYCTREAMQVRGERQHLCLPPRYGGRYDLSGRSRRRHRRAAGRRRLLLHVPPPDHQRGLGTRRHPPHADRV